MSAIRITQFASSDMSRVAEVCESLRAEISAAGAESIDVVSTGDGKGFIVAKYATWARLEATAEINERAFRKIIAAGDVEVGSVSRQSGEVVFSF